MSENGIAESLGDAFSAMEDDSLKKKYGEKGAAMMIRVAHLADDAWRMQNARAALEYDKSPIKIYTFASTSYPVRFRYDGLLKDLGGDLSRLQSGIDKAIAERLVPDAPEGWKCDASTLPAICAEAVSMRDNLVRQRFAPPAKPSEKDY